MYDSQLAKSAISESNKTCIYYSLVHVSLPLQNMQSLGNISAYPILVV